MLEAQSVASGWKPVLEEFFRSEKGRSLRAFLEGRKAQGAVIFPPTPFRALELTDLSDAKVVIMGQDPYHEKGQAQGLAFSVAPGCRIPPSLRNIFKELGREFGMSAPDSGDLSSWAAQGVLLINAVFTVEEGKAGGHAGKGWEVLTDEIIRRLARDASPKAFLLWGAYAQKKEALIRGEASGRHLVLSCNHPSPLSASRPPVPFVGCGHFARANEWLAEQGLEPVDWTSVSGADLRLL